jgi:cupin fold WbuC family metalloprotein
MDGSISAKVPALSRHEIDQFIRLAASSSRRRHPKILHEPGAIFNRVVNFVMHDSYMQPHLHPGPEKIEKIHLIEGNMAVLFFNDRGTVTTIHPLEKGRRDYVEVPAFTWHTYVTLSDHAVTYETMMGKYEPESWKEFAQWAPREDDPTAVSYLHSLKATAAASSAGRGLSQRSSSER